MAERVLTAEEILLGDVLHLWIDAYICKNPKSEAPAEVSELTFKRIEEFLTKRGITVDYIGARRALGADREQALTPLTEEECASLADYEEAVQRDVIDPLVQKEKERMWGKQEARLRN